MPRNKPRNLPQLSLSPRVQSTQNYTEAVRINEGLREESPSAAIKVWMGCDHLYAGPGRKPRFLKQMEEYVKRELQAIDTTEPKIQELKLQVYRNVFGCFVKEFKTYQPLLNDVKKEYENTLAHLQDQIRELGPLRSRLWAVSEECERKMLAQKEEEQAQIRALDREKQRLMEDMDAMREKEKDLQALVSHLKSELSIWYQRYREEHDARKLLVRHLSDLTSHAEKEALPTDKNTYWVDEDPVRLKLDLKMCREDLRKALELSCTQAACFDALEETHKQTMLQLERLQGDFDQLKCEYDTILEIQRRDGVKVVLNTATLMKANSRDKESLNLVKLYSEDERQLYISQLRGHLGGKGVVSIADVHAAMMLVDPALDTDTLDCNLSVAFQVNKEQLSQSTAQLDTGIVLERLSMADLARAAQLPLQD